MTIASEITRLQWAKATARTSIINKGVDVPASASIEDYHTYIDQIQKGDPRWNYLVSTILRTQPVSTLGKSDVVSFLWADMTYVDEDVMILAKPRVYDDYSSSGSSTMTVYINAYLLDWTSLDFQVWRAAAGGYGTNWSLAPDSYVLYKEWDEIHFKVCYRWYWSSYSYPTLELIYNKSTKTWSEVKWSESWPGMLPNTGDMWLYTASWEWCTSSSGCKPAILWTPILS